VPNHSKIVQPSQVIFPLGMGTALSLMGDATLYTVLPTHAAEAGITLAAVGIILSANRVIRLFLNGPMGLAYDRSQRRRLFIPALFIGALSTAIYAATSGFWPLLAGRLLWGLAWSGIWVGGSTIILDVTTDKDRGRWTGTYQVWFFLGIALGAFLGGLLTDWLGYHAAMWVGASVTALGGLVALFFLATLRFTAFFFRTTLRFTAFFLRPTLRLTAFFLVAFLRVAFFRLAAMYFCLHRPTP